MHTFSFLLRNQYYYLVHNVSVCLYFEMTAMSNYNGIIWQQIGYVAVTTHTLYAHTSLASSAL